MMNDRLRVDGDKNMHLLAFAFTIVFVWTGPEITSDKRSKSANNACLHKLSASVRGHDSVTF